MNLYIDFGGTSFRYQLDTLPIETVQSNTIDIKIFLDTIIKQYPAISLIAISFAGVVKNGKIVSSPNINIEKFDITTYVKERYNIPLLIDNDLNCAALAEHNNLQVDSLAIFYIGTGFGGAFIDNNKILTGANNSGGEIGHIPFKKSPFKCGCGRDDCLELYVSGHGIETWCDYFNIEKKYRRLDLLETTDNYKATMIIKNFYQGLEHAFHTAINLFDFDNLVLGGSVGKNEKIKKFLEEQFLKTAFKKEKLTITLSSLQEGSLEGTKFLNKNFKGSN